MPKPDERSYYLIFSTIHDVLKAEKRLKQHAFRFELIPIPRNMSSDCGSCIRLYDEIEKAMECMADIRIERRFSHNGKDFKALP